MGDHLKSWDQRLFQAEFAYNHSTNKSIGFNPFYVIYGYNLHAPLDLAPVTDVKQVSAKVEDLIAQIQEIHKATVQHLQDSTAKYKLNVDKMRRAMEFNVDDFVWAVLTEERFHVGEYNKLATRKTGPLEIFEKINPNAYPVEASRSY